MMSRSIHNRNENAITRAEELIAVGQSVNGLQVLHDAIMSKWFQHNLQNLDAIMIKFVELCVELRRDRMVKEGLHQYRTQSQNSTGTGLESAIKHFISEADSRFKTALNEYKLSIDQIEDLDAGVVIGNNSGSSWYGSLIIDSDIKEKQVLFPWMKFLWDAFKLTLDICRHNSRLEPLYFEIAQMALNFCKTYNRKNEYKRLCDLLHHHLNLIIKYPNQTNGVKLSSDSSHELQLNFRLEQLGLAIGFELWQEAFRIIEDIHSLFTITKKPIKATILIVYYESLSKLFTSSENYLFLSFTWYRLFLLCKSQSSSLGSLKKYANLMILSAASIPISRDHCSFFGSTLEEMEMKNQKFSSLLGLQQYIGSGSSGREALFKEIDNLSISSEIDDHILQLYNSIKTNSVDITNLTKTRSLFQLFKNEENFYILPIYKNYVTLMIIELSRYYSHIKFKSLESLVISTKGHNGSGNSNSNNNNLESTFPFYSREFSLKWLLLNGCVSGDFNLFINAKEQSIVFSVCGTGTSTGISTTSSTINNNSNNNGNLGIDSKFESDGQNSGREDDIGHLILQIQEIMSRIDDNRFTQVGKEAIELYQKTMENEHAINQEKLAIMEKKRELIEIERVKREKEEALERQRNAYMEQEKERIRQAEEVSQREKQRLEQEREEIRKEQMRKKEEQEARLREIQAQKKVQEKIIVQVKRLDYLERAMRENEHPLLVKDYENQKKVDLDAYNERKKMIIEKSKARHVADMEMKKRMSEISCDYQVYLELLKVRRLEEFQSSKKTLQQEIDQIKKEQRAAKELFLEEEAMAREASEKAQQEKQKALEERKASLKTAQDNLREKQRLLDLEAEETRLKREAFQKRSQQDNYNNDGNINDNSSFSMNENRQLFTKQQQQNQREREREEGKEKGEEGKEQEETAAESSKPKKWVPKSLSSKINK